MQLQNNFLFSNLSNLQRDLQVREIRDLNKSVQKKLLTLGSDYPEIVDSLIRLVTQYSIQLPKGPQTPSTSGSSYSTLTECSSSNSFLSDLPKHTSSSSVSTLNLHLET